MNGFIKVVLNQMLINKTLSQLGVHNDGQLNLKSAVDKFYNLMKPILIK